MSQPRFSFLTIVFNGDDFIRESLRSVYDFAHEIFIVEGAAREAWDIANHDGSSTDSTLEVLRSFPDPQGKIRIFQGKWQTKEEMTNVPMPHVTGDYIWRLDSDEVYKEEDLARLSRMLSDDPGISCVNIKTLDFFQGFDRIVVGRDDPGRTSAVDRIWKFKKGAHFVGHRPPDLCWPEENIFMGRGRRIEGEELAKKCGIYFYHYSYVTDKQIRDKISYYSKVYMRDRPIGVPFWRFVRRLPVVRVVYAWIFMHTIFDGLRRAGAFPDMNFDYFETVWKPWKSARLAVESKYGVTFNSADPFVTIPFEGSHPRAMEGRISSDAR